MNFAGHPPTQKTGKSKPKPRKRLKPVSDKRKAQRASPEGQAGLDHMGLVRQLPCCICVAYGFVQRSRTEAHHCKSGRFGNLKEIDRHTIPLCHSHHNKLTPYPGDENKLGYHNGQKTWEAEYGVDYDYLDTTLDQIEAL